MKHRHLTALCSALIAAACLIGGCSKKNGGDTDTASSSDTNETPHLSDTLNTDAVIKPSETETAAPAETETMTAEPTETLPIETETETEKETASVIILTPVETEAAPVTSDPAETESETESAVPVLPVETPKIVIDITDQAVPGGDAVTGQIASAQSENIQLILNYSFLREENGNYMLTLDVGLSCYELWCSERVEGGVITVDGVSRTFTSPAIEHEAHQKIYVPFFTQTYNCTGNTTASIDVSWRFNGNYGGVDIGTLSLGRILQWGTPGTNQPVETESPITVTPADPDPAVPEETVTDDTPAPETDSNTSDAANDPVDPEEGTDNTDPMPPADA